MNIVILDDYQDAVRKLHCASRLDPYSAKVYTNTVKGQGQLAVRLKDADIIVLVRERTQITRQLVEKLPRLKLIAQTGKIGSHIDVAACTERGIAVAEGVGSPCGAGGTHLGARDGGHATVTAVHCQPQARRVAAVRAQGGLHASQLLHRQRVARKKRWESGVMAVLVNWWLVMAARLA
jgi:hypothetical protein